MKAAIATLILFIGLLVPGCTILETNEHKQARNESFAWLEMCQLLEDETDYRCNRLMAPLVEYEKMRPGLWGYYEGGATIFINSELEGTDLTDVLMHEGIHYVHVMHQFIEVPGPAEQVCWSENEAWTLTGLYWNEDNSRWWRAYPHCW